MAKSCPNCATISAAEARFCRACGVPLASSQSTSVDDSNNVSPMAETVPLSNEARSTDGLAFDDSTRRAPDTNRVGHAEMEELLRRPRLEATQENSYRRKAKGPQTIPSAPVYAASPTVALPDLSTASAPLAAGEAAGPTATIAPQARIQSRRAWMLALVCSLLIAFVVGLSALFISQRRPRPTINDAPANLSDERKNSIDVQLSEADALLASGNANAAIARLREAVKLDPANAPAHLRLGDALDRSGAHEEAMAEYLVATQQDEHNASAWRALASAQFAAGRYNDAADSYHHLIALISDKELDEDARFQYADALRLTGQLNDARQIYQQIAASTANDEVRQTARRHLAELAPPQTSNINSKSPQQTTASASQSSRGDRSLNANRNRPLVSGLPPITSTLPPPSSVPPSLPAANSMPSEKSNRSGRDAGRKDADHYYVKAMKIIGGRDLGRLKDGEVAEALNYFLRVNGGAHKAQADAMANKLFREYEERKKNFKK